MATMRECSTLVAEFVFHPLVNLKRIVSYNFCTFAKVTGSVKNSLGKGFIEKIHVVDPSTVFFPN